MDIRVVLLLQLLSVDIRVGGLDCASCAMSVESRLKRIRGVESVKFDAEQGRVGVALAAGNRVTLDAIRDALKGIGYTPGDAEIVVAGAMKRGKLSLPHQPEAFAAELPDGDVKVKGVVPAGTTKITGSEPVRSESPRPDRAP